MMSILKRARPLLLAAFGLGAAGVHADVAQVRFDRAAGASIASIDVLEVVQQQRLMVLPRTTHVDGAPPARGTTPAFANPIPVQAALDNGTAALGEGFTRRGSSLGNEFGRQLVSALQAKGYDAKLLRGQKPHQNVPGRGQSMAGVNSQADAVLYVVLRFAGYKDDAASGGLVPMAGVDAYLFDKSGRLLYRQVFNQGFRLLPGAEVEQVPVGNSPKFANRAALVSGAENAAHGLVQVLQPVAARIADQLAK
jgi:hypothetical protein